MGKSRFIELMAKSMGKTATEEELKELDHFLNQFPEYKKIHQVTNALRGDIKTKGNQFVEEGADQKLGKLWESIKASEEAVAADVESIALPESEKRTSGNWKWMAAAAVLLVASTAFFFTFFNSSAEGEMQYVSVPYGKTKEVVLPDGTKVKLNAGSKLTFPKVFARNKREVKLVGEGFFDVEKNPGKPFFVRTNDVLIKVLGTVFNVKAYSDDHDTETTLFKGKVEVALEKRPEKKIILVPNEKLIVANSLPQGRDGDNKVSRMEYQLKTIPDLDIADIQEAAWLKNRLVFTNEPFELLAKQMERKYDVKIIFNDQALKAEQISGVFEQESIANALNIIKMTTPFAYRIDKQTIYISKQ